MKPLRPEPIAEVLLDKRDLAARWGCSIKSVERRVADGTLRPIHLGRLVRFTREEVLRAEKAMQKVLSCFVAWFLLVYI